MIFSYSVLFHFNLTQQDETDGGNIMNFSNTSYLIFSFLYESIPWYSLYLAYFNYIIQYFVLAYKTKILIFVSEKI